MLLLNELIGHKHATKVALTTWARSEAGLSRLPVTEEIAGSNPVGPATKTVHLLVDFFRAKIHYYLIMNLYT